MINDMTRARTMVMVSDMGMPRGGEGNGDEGYGLMSMGRRGMMG